MTDESNAIETTIPAQYWEEMVQSYTDLFGAPQQLSDSEVLFTAPDDGLMLRLTKDTETERQERTSMRPPDYYRVYGANGYQILVELYNTILRSDKTAYSIQVPMRVGIPGKPYLILAFIGHGDPCGILESRTDCLIHNPNW